MTGRKVVGGGIGTEHGAGATAFKLDCQTKRGGMVALQRQVVDIGADVVGRLGRRSRVGITHHGWRLFHVGGHHRRRVTAQPRWR